ncbi:hypothetical protein MKX01_038565 [Papaver californicum]|nr:hypothetical protein MKX01_038565 [Papaver californicum]
MDDDQPSCLHIAMYPWFAFGHLSPFLSLSNKLAERGHIISFMLPDKTQSKLELLNIYPNLIQFIPLVLPPIEGLPPGSETIAEIPLKPLFPNLNHWLLASKFGVKSVHYCTTCMAAISYLLVPATNKVEKGIDTEITEDDLKLIFLQQQQPPGFPPSSIRLHRHEAKAMSFITYRDYGNISFLERLSLNRPENSNRFIDFIGDRYGKQVLLSGALLPKPPSFRLEEKWDKWLNQFDPRALTMDKALTRGYKERIEDRGMVENGWVQQQLIMAHPSVGCFVSHCGLSSVTETLVNNPQLVLLPNAGDQYIIARLLAEDLKVGVEESICKAIFTVMDEDNEIGKVVRENRLKMKELLVRDGFEDDYIY